MNTSNFLVFVKLNHYCNYMKSSNCDGSRFQYHNGCRLKKGIREAAASSKVFVQKYPKIYFFFENYTYKKD